VVENEAKLLVAVIAGGGVTTPDIERARVAAPELLKMRSPSYDPASAAASRTKTLRFTTLPDEGTRVTELENAAPPPRDTSKRAGAVTVMLPVRLEPLTSSVCSDEAILALVEKLVSEPVTSRRGRAATAPVTATERPAAPAAATAISPETVPGEAEAERRAEIVAETEPLLGASVRVAKKFAPSVDTSKLAGAVTVTLPVRLDPVTVKLCEADDAPSVVLKGVSVPDVESKGCGMTVPLTLTVLLLAPLLDTVMFPLGEPTLAAAERRAEIVVLAKVPAPGVSVRLPA
jgi:hypothetical protein